MDSRGRARNGEESGSSLEAPSPAWMARLLRPAPLPNLGPLRPCKLYLLESLRQLPIKRRRPFILPPLVGHAPEQNIIDLSAGLAKLFKIDLGRNRIKPLPHRQFLIRIKPFHKPHREMIGVGFIVPQID